MHYTFLAFLSSADILLYRRHFTDFNWFILDSDFYTLKITVPQSQWYLPNCISTFFCSWSSPWCTILCWIWASFILSAGCWTTKARCMIGPGVHAKVLLIVITGYKCDPHLLRGHRWRFECIPYTALLEKYKHKNNYRWHWIGWNAPFPWHWGGVETALFLFIFLNSVTYIRCWLSHAALDHCF